MKKTVLPFILLFLISASYGQVAVNTDGSTAEGSSMLDVKSDTAGILIPRMTMAQRNAIAHPIEGLLIYVTTDSTFYYYRTGGWTKVGRGSSGWNVGSTGIYTDSLVGIGTSSPTAKLAVYDNNSDTALFVNNTNDDNDTHYSFYNKLSTSGTGLQYGIYNNLITSGTTTNPIYAFENYLQDNGSSNKNVTMIRNVVFGSGDGSQEGISQQISNTGNGYHYGIDNYFEGSGSGSKFGIRNFFSTSAGGTLYGLYNNINGSGNNAKYGVYNDIPTSAGGTHYGTYNHISGNGSGEQFGIFNHVENSNSNNANYGTYNRVEGSGSDSKYGTFNYIPETAGGTHYGIESWAEGSDNYAGYFKGNVYIQDKTGIGTSSPNEQLEIANSSGAGRMIVSDGGGTSRYATLLVSPTSSSNGRIESYYYGDWSGITLEINTSGNGNTIFGGSVLPEADGSKDLGTALAAWNYVYYHHLTQITAASFANRQVTNEMMKFPLKSLNNEKTDDGLDKLDISSLPPVLIHGNSLNTGYIITYNYQANYEQQEQINTLRQEVKQQQETIEQLKKQLSEIEQLKQQLNELKNITK